MMKHLVRAQTSDLGKLADTLYLPLSRVRAPSRRTVTLVVSRATGLPDRSCLFDDSIIVYSMLPEQLISLSASQNFPGDGNRRGVGGGAPPGGGPPPPGGGGGGRPPPTQ